MKGTVKVIRRNKIDYLAYMVVLIFFVRSILKIDRAAIEIIDIFNVFGSILFICILIRIILNRNIAIIDLSNITLIRTLFYKVIIPIKDIERFEEKIGPFTRSYLLTKDGRKIKISSAPLNENDRIMLENIIESR